MHRASYVVIVISFVISFLLFLSPVFSISTNPCSSCHGLYSQYLDILEGDSRNNLPTTLNVGQTATVAVAIENRVNTARNTALFNVRLTLTSQNNHFTVAPPTYNLGTLPEGIATATWQITAVSEGQDALVITVSGRNSHEGVSFTDRYSPNPSINIQQSSNSTPPQPSPSPTPFTTPTPSTTHTVTMQASSGGTTTPPPDTYSHTAGTTLTITAAANTNYKFDHWLINNVKNTTNPLTLAITSAVTVVPVFSQVSNPQIEPSSPTEENETTTQTKEKNLTVTILSPAEGEKWQAGTTYSIEWNATSESTIPLNIIVEYASSHVSGEWAIIAENISNNGSLTWKPTTSLKPCYIRVSAVDTDNILETATAITEIEINQATPEFPSFLTVIALIPFIGLICLFLRRRQLKDKNTSPAS